MTIAASNSGMTGFVANLAFDARVDIIGGAIWRAKRFGKGESFVVGLGGVVKCMS